MRSSQTSGVQSATNTSEVGDRVLSAVAEKEGRSPLEFDRLLSEVIDPDALDNLFQNVTQQGSVTFSYMGYRVTVGADGHIAVTDQSE